MEMNTTEANHQNTTEESVQITFSIQPGMFVLFNFYCVLSNFLAWILRNKDNSLDDNSRSIITFLDSYIVEYINLAVMFMDVPAMFQCLFTPLPALVATLSRYLHYLCVLNAAVLYAVMCLSRVAAARQSEMFMDADQKKVAKTCARSSFGVSAVILSGFCINYMLTDDSLFHTDTLNATTLKVAQDNGEIFNFIVIILSLILIGVCNAYIKCFVRREGLGSSRQTGSSCNLALKSATVGLIFALSVALLLVFLHLTVNFVTVLIVLIVANLAMNAALLLYVLKDKSFALSFLKEKFGKQDNVQTQNWQQLDPRTLDAVIDNDDGGVFVG